MNAMRVADATNRRICWVTSGQTLREVAGLLSRHDISGAPVRDGSSNLVGYVTRTDIVDALARTADIASLPVDEVMSREVLSIEPDCDLDEALRYMVFEGVHHLLVRDAAGDLLGVLSSFDVFQALLRERG